MIFEVKVGRAVRLCHGGVAMTVAEVAGDNAMVLYFQADGSLASAWVPVACLRSV
jgi:uncharacterized protein YodC (DUF2158 family)